MKPPRKFHPDLKVCALEDRFMPAVANLGVIVLTTGGYVLMTPIPGGSAGRTAIPTSFSMTGSSGISSIRPGNSTGIPALATTGTAGSSGGAGVTGTVGSAANLATDPTIPLVVRNTIANGALAVISPDRPTVREWCWSDIVPLRAVSYCKWSHSQPGVLNVQVNSTRALGKTIDEPPTRLFCIVPSPIARS